MASPRPRPIGPRIQDGRALLGPLEVDYPQHPHGEPRAAAGYARPHELDVERGDAGGGGLVWATLRHVTAAGAVMRLELEDASGAVIQVELPRDRYEALRPGVGEALYVRPRQLRVFVGDVPEADGRGRP